MRRLSAVLLCVILVVSMMPIGVPVLAASEGVCGDNVYWSVSGNTLIISGQGEMQNYTNPSGSPPWSKYRNITHVYVNEGVTSIGNFAFYDRNMIIHVSLPNSLTSIGMYAFGRCISLKSITLPAAVTEIGVSAFETCTALEEIQLPQGVTQVADGTFDTCSALERVTLPEGIKTIGMSAFYRCGSLKEIQIPGTVEYIRSNAFTMSGLNSVDIPAGVKMLDPDVFWSCDHLRKVRFYGDAPSFDANTFRSVWATAYYPSDNATWSDDVRQSYGGTVSWAPLDHVHSYTEIVTPPGCETMGYTTHLCTDCGFSYRGVTTDILMHDMTQATCTEPSICRREGCGYVASPPLGHRWDNPAANRQTCTVCGYTHTHEHEYDALIVEPKCWDRGYTEHTCTVCGHTYRDGYVEALEHQFGEPWVIMVPTCTQPGVMGHACELCGHGDQFDTELAEHNWANVSPIPGIKICASCGTTVCSGPHTYAHQYDYKCDACGLERVVDMTRSMVDMFRMYDPNSGEHFYTGSVEERDFLVSVGWHYEGIGFTFPLTTGDPVHRLYDPVTGEHLYTMDVEEKDRLMSEGWNYEGIAFNSAFENEVPQFRLHNPNATRGSYHFTASIEERDNLINAGWEYQGIGWYSCGKQ